MNFVPAGSGGFVVDPHVLLESGNEVRHDLERHATLARTGARITWSASAAWMSFSVSGITSQKDSVKSKGECEMAQKFA